MTYPAKQWAEADREKERRCPCCGQWIRYIAGKPAVPKATGGTEAS